MKVILLDAGAWDYWSKRMDSWDETHTYSSMLVNGTKIWSKFTANK